MVVVVGVASVAVAVLAARAVIQTPIRVVKMMMVSRTISTISTQVVTHTGDTMQCEAHMRATSPMTYGVLS